MYCRPRGCAWPCIALQVSKASKLYEIASPQHPAEVHTSNLCAMLQVSNSLKAVRDRINSVKNTQKITDAMKLVAAAKVRRAQDAVINGRPFSENLVKVSRDDQTETATSLGQRAATACRALREEGSVGAEQELAGACFCTGRMCPPVACRGCSPCLERHVRLHVQSAWQIRWLRTVAVRAHIGAAEGAVWRQPAAVLWLLDEGYIPARGTRHHHADSTYSTAGAVWHESAAALWLQNRGCIAAVNSDSRACQHLLRCRFCLA